MKAQIDCPLQRDVFMRLSDLGLLREKAYIAGRWVGLGPAASFEVQKPATSEIIAKVANLGAAEAGLAIDAADRAPLCRNKYPTATRVRLVSESGASLHFAVIPRDV